MQSDSVVVDRKRESLGGSDWEIYADTEEDSDFVTF